MKKRILSVLLGCSLLVGTVFTNAVSIEFEEIAETDSLNFEVNSNILSEDIEFSKEEINSSEIHLKKCSQSIVIREMKTKMTLRFHLTPNRLAKNITSCGSTC